MSNIFTSQQRKACCVFYKPRRDCFYYLKVLNSIKLIKRVPLLNTYFRVKSFVIDYIGNAKTVFLEEKKKKKRYLFLYTACYLEMLVSASITGNVLNVKNI